VRPVDALDPAPAGSQPDPVWWGRSAGRMLPHLRGQTTWRARARRQKSAIDLEFTAAVAQIGRHPSERSHATPPGSPRSWPGCPAAPTRSSSRAPPTPASVDARQRRWSATQPAHDGSALNSAKECDKARAAVVTVPIPAWLVVMGEGEDKVTDPVPGVGACKSPASRRPTPVTCVPTPISTSVRATEQDDRIRPINPYSRISRGRGSTDRSSRGHQRPGVRP
jgi:hypothetical protein